MPWPPTVCAHGPQGLGAAVVPIFRLASAVIKLWHCCDAAPVTDRPFGRRVLGVCDVFLEICRVLAHGGRTVPLTLESGSALVGVPWWECARMLSV